VGFEIGVEELSLFVRACHKTAGYGLLQCSSGNMSWRVSQEHALLTVSRSWLGELREDQVAVCRITDGRCVNGRTPTVESVFHLGVLRSRPELNVVLHFQSPWATAIACGRPEDYDFNVIIETPVYIGEPAIIEYLMPGSPALAEAVIVAMQDHDMASLKNHGLVTVGRDFNDAIQKAAFFELTCQILLCGRDIRPLPPEALEPLRQAGKA